MAKPLITISPLGSVYILGIPLTGGVKFALNELSVYNVQENENCIYLANASVNPLLPKFNIIFSKSKEPALQGRIDRIYIHAHNLNINECNRCWEYFKLLFRKMNLVYSQKNAECVCDLYYETRLCQIKVFKQFGLGDNPNICPFGISINSKYLHNEESNADLITALFHDKIEYTPMDDKPKKTTPNKLKYLFVFLFSTIICILLYLTALNGRYTKVENYYVFDKWTSKFIEPK